MKKVVLIGLGGLTALWLVKSIHGRVKQHRLSLKAKAFLAKAHPNSPDLPLVSAGEEGLILASSATQLAALIREGAVTSVKVVAVYIKRALQYGRRLHLNAEESFAEALAQAAACDEQLKKDPSSCGRLHGVPICVKDVISERGKVCTCGVARLTDTPCTEDAVVLSILKAQGAIPFLRASVPQAVDWYETENHIFGRGGNPWDDRRSCGGSAEAAMVVSMCAPLGISTDARAAIQHSCAYTGAMGIRLTPDRVSHLGLVHAHASGISPHEWLLNTSIGVVGRTAEDLTTVCQLWFSDTMFRQDMSVPDLPFNTQMYNEVKRLKVGICTKIGNVDAIPGAAARAKAIGEILKTLGYDVVEFQLPDAGDLLRQTTNAVSSYIINAIDDSLQGEADVPAYSKARTYHLLMKFHRTSQLLMRLAGEKRLSEHLKLPLLATSAQTISVYYVLRDWRINLVKVWQQAGLDLLVCPTWPLVAPKHGELNKAMMAVGYTTLWNLMGFPVGVVPTGPLSKDELKYTSDINDRITSGCKEICDGAEGLPFSFSVVGMPYTDERVLGFMRVLEEHGVSKFATTLSL